MKKDATWSKERILAYKKMSSYPLPKSKKQPIWTLRLNRRECELLYYSLSRMLDGMDGKLKLSEFYEIDNLRSKIPTERDCNEM